MVDIKAVIIGIALISGVLVFLLYRLFQAVAKVEELEKENKVVQDKLNGAYQGNKELSSDIEDMKNTYMRQGFFYENLALPFYEIANRHGKVAFFTRLTDYKVLDFPEVDVVKRTHLDGTNEFGRFIEHKYKEFFFCSLEGCSFEDKSFDDFRADMFKYIQRIGLNVEVFYREDFGTTVYFVISGIVNKE